MTTDYQGNSNQDKEPKPEKKLEKVVKGEVVVKQPGVASKFKHIFLGGDIRTASEYVVAQVLLPALRTLAWDMIRSGSERVIFGDRHPQAQRPMIGQSYRPRVDYSSPGTVGRQGAGGRSYPPNQTPWTVSAPGKPFQDITVGTKQEAEDVMEAMAAVVGQYEMVSVADLYEIIGLESSNVDHKWGWTNLAKMSLNQNRDGWTISFPPVEELS